MSDSTVGRTASAGRFTKRFEVRILQLLAGRRQGLPRVQPGQLRRVLLLRHDRIGDMVITSPLLQALHSLAPQAELDILAAPANSVIPQCDPRVHSVFTWPKSLWQRARLVLQLRRRGYDAVFQLILGRSSLPAVLCSLIAGPGGRTIGQYGPGSVHLLNHSVDTTTHTHFAPRTFALIHGLDVPDDLVMPPVDVPPCAQQVAWAQHRLAGLLPAAGKFAVLNISASQPDREFSGEQNAAIIRYLLERCPAVLVLSTPDAADRAAQLACGFPHGVYAWGGKTLMQAAAIVSRACLMVSPDTGIVHIAGAFGVPQVVVYPAYGNPQGWVPYNAPCVPVQIDAAQPMWEMPLGSVFAGIDRMLAEAAK